MRQAMSDQDVESQVQTLIGEWCSLISSDHHKDRDCHFEICKRWSYGNKPYYYVSHRGYIYHNCDFGCEERATYAEARAELLNMLKSMIEKYKTLRDEEDNL